MEPERERIRPRKTPPPPPPSFDVFPEEFKEGPVGTPKKEQKIQKNYAQETCVVLGFGFLMVGLLGFVIPYFLNAHLSYLHNVIHLITGATALWFGFHSNPAAKKFSYIFGAFYLILGMLGFVAGVSGIASVANPTEDRFLWRVIPEVLELGTSDHVIHLLAGAVFLLSALLVFRVRPPLEES